MIWTVLPLHAFSRTLHIHRVEQLQVEGFHEFPGGVQQADGGKEDHYTSTFDLYWPSFRNGKLEQC